MFRIVLILFLFSFSILAQAQENFNSDERISLENCAFKESGTERHDCYKDILHNLFVEEINTYLEHLELAPKAVFQTLIEINLNSEGTFELTKIDTDHEKIEALIRRRIEKLEAVLPLEDEDGNAITTGFSMIFASHVTEDGKLVSGLPKQKVGGFEDLVKPVEFAIIERVPIFPGCGGGDNKKLKECMSTNVQEHVLTYFNLDVAKDLGLPGGIQRIYVKFKIDTLGTVMDVKARASHPVLAEEATRVVRSLPKMEPGEHKGKRVGVLYALPIIFKVEESAKEKRARLKREKKARKKS
ncbi:MAG: energy transducer TonB [Bacteroidota bacterium]